MVKFLKKIQGLVSVTLAVGIFLCSGPIVQRIDPTAGAYDIGALNGLAMGIVAYLTAIWISWLVLQMEWPSLDKYIDFNSWAQDWRVVKPETRIWFLFAVWTVLLTGAILCLLGGR